ncbi:hypothetical protein SXCC_04657 [Gluconacetobacter sp. SXCC-1]|nr:hypothetical protein SXCC_04657 [Gluconacetobacter sp. SXCC-1]
MKVIISPRIIRPVPVPVWRETHEMAQRCATPEAPELPDVREHRRHGGNFCITVS